MRCEREEQQEQERQQDQQPDPESVAPPLQECYNQKKLMAWARVQRSSDDQQRISALALEEKWDEIADMVKEVLAAPATKRQKT